MATLGEVRLLSTALHELVVYLDGVFKEHSPTFYEPASPAEGEAAETSVDLLDDLLSPG